MAKASKKEIKKLLALDLSTSVTGWAFFEDGKLVDHGMIVPKVKGITKMLYPEKQLAKMRDISVKLFDLLMLKDPDHIVIEEINRGISRIGQKSLDALHFLFIDEIDKMNVYEDFFSKLTYYDSNGKDGWRTHLKMRLGKDDKEYNKMAREYNKKNAKKIKAGAAPRRDIVDWKNLAIRFVNENHKLDLDKKVKGSGDIADAICMGHAFLMGLK